MESKGKKGNWRADLCGKQVALGTKVWLEVPKAVAKNCSNKAVEMFMHNFTSRLVIQVK